MKNTRFIALLFASIILHSCCKDNDCQNQLLANADFDIEVLFSDFAGDYYLNVANDTVRKGATIRFKAKDSTATYEWVIGTDPRTFTTRKVELEFDIVGTIPIRLVTKKTVDKNCFPNDDGSDTVQKSFVVVDATLAPIVGQYFEGYVTSRPTEIFKIFLKDDLAVGPFVDNFPNSCSRPLHDLARDKLHIYSDYRYFLIGDPDNLKSTMLQTCPLPYGWGTIGNDHVSVRLDYQIWNPTKQKLIKETFIGIKK